MFAVFLLPCDTQRITLSQSTPMTTANCPVHVKSSFVPHVSRVSQHRLMSTRRGNSPSTRSAVAAVQRNVVAGAPTRFLLRAYTQGQAALAASGTCVTGPAIECNSHRLMV